MSGRSSAPTPNPSAAPTSTSPAFPAHAPAGDGLLTPVLQHWASHLAHETLSNVPGEGKRRITLQVKGFVGDPNDEEEFRVLLHDGEFWIKASLINTYRIYIQEQQMPDVMDIVVIHATLGGPDNLLIVRTIFPIFFKFSAFSNIFFCSKSGSGLLHFSKSRRRSLETAFCRSMILLRSPMVGCCFFVYLL